jgi:hypothetical protein
MSFPKISIFSSRQRQALDRLLESQLLSDLFRKSRQLVHARRVRQVACKVLRQIPCNVGRQAYLLIPPVNVSLFALLFVTLGSTTSSR